MMEGELRRAMRLLKSAPGGQWQLIPQGNRRYAVACQIELPPTPPGVPIVFISDLTPLQALGVVELIEYLRQCQAEGSGESG